MLSPSASSPLAPRGSHTAKCGSSRVSSCKKPAMTHLSGAPRKCDVEIRKDLCASALLTGGYDHVPMVKESTALFFFDADESDCPLTLLNARFEDLSMDCFPHFRDSHITAAAANPMCMVSCLMTAPPENSHGAKDHPGVSVDEKEPQQTREH